jgi:hypothetical protein
LRDETSEIRERVETLAGGRERDTNVSIQHYRSLNSLKRLKKDSGVLEGRKRLKRSQGRRDGTAISIQPDAVFTDVAIRGLIDEWMRPGDICRIDGGAGWPAKAD